MALCPRFNVSNEVINLFRLNLNKAKVTEIHYIRKEISQELGLQWRVDVFIEKVGNLLKQKMEN